jgi:hypothetical protein
MPIEGWLVTTVVRLAYRQRARRRRQEELVAHLSVSSLDPGPVEQAGNREKALTILAHIDGLPARYRDVLVLHGIEGLTQMETAQALGITAGSLRVRLHRARSLLRTRLEHRPGAPFVTVPLLLADWFLGLGPRTRWAGLGVATCLVLLMVFATVLLHDEAATSGSGQVTLSPTTEDRQADPGGVGASGQAARPPASLGPEASSVGGEARQPPQVSKERPAAQGVVIDPAGRPLAGATVAVAIRIKDFQGRYPGLDPRQLKPHHLEPPVRCVLTDEQGRFVLSTIPATPCKIGAFHARYLPSLFAEIPAARTAAPPEELLLQVQAGQSITGRVVDRRGGPVAGVDVGCHLVPALMGMLASTKTGPDGRFTLQGLVPEVPHGLWVTSSDLVLEETALEPRSYLPGAGDEAELVVVRGASVQGAVLTQDGTPLAGVTVIAAMRGTYPFLAPHEQVTSGPDGAFAFGPRPPGQNEIWAQAQGYAPQDRRVVELASAEHLEGLTLTLDPLEGRITGRVMTLQDELLAGVRVTASGNRSGATAMTAADGTFELEPVGDGPHQITVRDRGRDLSRGAGPTVQAQAGDNIEVRVAWGIAVTGQVGGPDGEPVTRFSVTGVVMANAIGLGMDFLSPVDCTDPEGRFELVHVPPAVMALDIAAAGLATSRVELTYDGPVEHLGTIPLDQGQPLIGTVVTHEGASIPGATVHLRRLTPGTCGAFALRPGPGSRTSVEGAFSFDAVGPGDYQLLVSHPTHVQLRRELKITSGPRSPLRVVMNPGSTLVGCLTDPSGEPLGGREVTAEAVRATSLRDLPTSRSATTDRGGCYRIDGLAPGSCRVTAQMGQTRVVRHSTEVTTHSRIVELTAGTETTCDFGAEGGPQTVRVHGTVMGWGGQDGGFPELLRIRGEQGSALCVVEPDGSYELDPLPVGDYRLLLSRADCRLEVPLTLAGAGNTEHDLVLATGQIHGVVSRFDHRPVRSARVSALGPGPGACEVHVVASADDRGRFVLHNLPPGTYGLSASVDGLRARVEGITVSEGERVGGVTIEARTGGSLHIEVHDGKGRPCRLSSIEVRTMGGERVGIRRQLVRPGQWLVPDIPAGVYRVLAGSPGLGTGWVDGVEVLPEAEDRVQVSLDRFRGRFTLVVTREGEPVPGAEVGLRDAGGRAIPDLSFVDARPDARTGMDGAFTSSLYPAGPYTVVVRTAGGAKHEAAVLIPAQGATSEVGVELAR